MSLRKFPHEENNSVFRAFILETSDSKMVENKRK